MVPNLVFHSGSDLAEVHFFHPENICGYFGSIPDYLVHCYNHPNREFPCMKSVFPPELKLPYANVSCFEIFSSLHETTIKSGAINNSEGLYNYKYNQN